MGKQWYLIATYLGHQGSGRLLDIDIYVWTKNVLETLDKYKRIGGVKKRKTPNIRKLTMDESIRLEQLILNDGLTLEKAKRKWYTTYEKYKWWHKTHKLQLTNI